MRFQRYFCHLPSDFRNKFTSLFFPSAMIFSSNEFNGEYLVVGNDLALPQLLITVTSSRYIINQIKKNTKNNTYTPTNFYKKRVRNHSICSVLRL